MLNMRFRNRKETFNDLEKEMVKLLNKDFEKRTDALVRDLKANTPVDSGEARDGWVADRRLNVFTNVVDSNVSVRNDVDHIVALNSGTSAQAPSRFVESTALRHGKPRGTLVQIK